MKNRAFEKEILKLDRLIVQFILKNTPINLEIFVEWVAVLFDIFRWLHFKKLVELFPEILDIIDSNLVSHFRNGDVRRDQNLSSAAEANKADEAVGGLARNRFDAVV